MSWGYIKNKTDYDEYVEAFTEGTKHLEDGNFSTGEWECPNCGCKAWDNCDPCPECSSKPEEWGDPYFSWRSCGICGGRLGGDREKVIGWLKGARENDWAAEYRWEGEACIDCIYFNEYGQLDDGTMFRVEETQH